MEAHLMMESLRSGDGSCLLPAMPTSKLGVAVTTAVATVSLVAILRRLLSPEALRRPVIRNPLATVVPTMTEDELKALVHPPDLFPGTRDVATPYGSIRVCEWGPEDGPRVMLIHGISTSCITLGKLAHGLVRRGCRVMLFDLFGRGYSDGVGDLPHDARLYVSQALMAMASSPVSWTGRGTLRLIGYSMGAGISTHFAAAFPDLVSSLVLIAPAGLIRPANFGLSRVLLQSGLVPDRLLAALMRRRLQRPIASKKAIQDAQDAQDAGAQENKSQDKLESPLSDDIIEVGIAEAADPNTTDAATVDDNDYDDRLVNLKSRMLGSVQWMVRHHDGFLPAFMSSARYAPLAEQEEAWRAIARRPKGTTSIILGKHDEVIHISQFEEDAPPLIGGKDHVRWTVLPGAHDIPMTHTKEVLAEIDELWKGQYQ